MSNYFNNISYLVIEVNSSCNLKCTYCNREELVKTGYRETKTISPLDLENALIKFTDCKIDTIKLEGISEPMLHNKFDECTKVVKKFFPNAHLIVATNLQYEISKTSFLKSLEYIDMLYLSIDGVGDIYEKARPPAKFSRLIQSLEYIKENVPPSLKKKLHINFVASNENVDTLSEIYKLKDFYSLSSVRINIAQNWDEKNNSKISFTENFINTLKKYKQDVKGVPDWSYSDCFWPFEGLVIDVFGDVRQCIINTSQKPLANIHKDNLETFFNSSDHYVETRRKLSCDTAGDNCRNCDYKYLATPLREILGELKVEPRSFNK